jgi:HNH endonuclease
MPTPSKGIRAGRGGPDISKPLFEIECSGYATACWIWKRKLDMGGYAVWRRKGHSTPRAHKWLWQSVNGPVPQGLQLDHLCRNRACVRPDHLEAVTAQENVRRGLVRKFSDEQIEACITDIAVLGFKRAARKHGINHAWVREVAALRGVKSPLKTGRQPWKVTA